MDIIAVNVTFAQFPSCMDGVNQLTEDNCKDALDNAYFDICDDGT